MTTFFESLAIQRRVLGALMMRELHTRYGRDNIGFLWFVGEPLIFAGGVLLLWRVMRGPYMEGMPVVAFTMCGYVPLLLFRHSVSRAIMAMRPNVGLLYHRQVTPLDLVASRILLEVAGNILAFAVCFLGLFAVGMLHLPDDFPLMLLGYGYMMWFTVGAALMIGALSERSEVVEKIWMPISYLMLPVSGAYVMVGWLPAEYREWYLYMPTVHAYEMIRVGYFGGALKHYWDQSYIAAWSALLMLFGLSLYRNARAYLILD